MPDYYANDLSPAQSLVTLERADDILAATLAGRDWTERAVTDRQLCLDDPDRSPDRASDRNALQDASALLATLPWKGVKIAADQAQPFPRAYLTTPEGRRVIGIPAEVEKATALLAVALLERLGQAMTPEVFRAYQIGEVRGEFRTPIRDDLPRQIRILLATLLNGGSSWSPVRP
jgi:hypothetical protein